MGAAATNLLQPLAQSVFAGMSDDDLAPAQLPCPSNHCDFMMFWSAGRSAAHGEADVAYDPDKRLAWEHAHVLPSPRVPYLYPPKKFRPLPDLFSLRLGHSDFFIGAVVLSVITFAARNPKAAGGPADAHHSAGAAKAGLMDAIVPSLPSSTRVFQPAGR